MEMRDMGQTRETCEAISSGGNKKEKYYPSVSINTEQLPELSDMKIGSKVSLHIVGKICGARQDKDNTSYDIEIRECGIGDKASKDEFMDMSEDEKDEYQKKSLEKEKEEE